MNGRAAANPADERPLALSLGDPAGIGPELALRSWLARDDAGVVPFAVIFGFEVLREAAAKLALDVPVQRIETLANTADVFQRALPVLADKDGRYTPGMPNPDSAQLALASLEEATRLAFCGEAGGVVTAPIAKSLLADVGFDHPGQTEYMAAACGLDPQASVMMLAGPRLRTVPVTVHCALADVSGLLSKDLIVARATIVATALKNDFGIANPRLAVTGLNPHAGEDGRFGREEIEVIAPAIAALQAQRINATGPHPGDALFTPRSRKTFDAAICMYHDQALIPLKALDFDEGVNVTLGLPIVRTSPDHGTAFDIAGTGLADPGATIAALCMAGDIAARRACARA
ncbi:4-hydroxythreonine-4-phosphate dehydrogenase [Alteripontixanthobacter maritimus]|uniref:4-hydroxythreonine-4-phosphate dehydrogenase n=1 Tax=Alteripontixanthobacter maritimus TaxID=2161824 RepID=A0A369Q7M2_9SPHN|nr:4-hydroxythreonine-4-phosphate dehydrogenase PdxA [Alteripontixanthobacter maritimus]RDC59525.1 4-hydroxythreonine-4-phosphate dehydrogenase [Alteripontixanthobacter maritimus]